METKESGIDRTNARAPEPLRKPCRITLDEAANGCERVVWLDRKLCCADCDGRGGAPGATYETCSRCNGRGRELETAGAIVKSRPCPACLGSKGDWTIPCATCAGSGETTSPVRQTVNIAPGVHDGWAVRLEGKGNDLGEGAGDAYLMLEIEPHATLTRDDDDLHATAVVPKSLRASGGELSVPWLKGEARVPIPRGFTGTELRLRGWGCVRYGSPYTEPPETTESAGPYREATTPRGDLVVTISDGPESERMPREHVAGIVLLAIAFVLLCAVAYAAIGS